VIAGKGLIDSVAKAGMRVAREGGRDEPMLVRVIGPISGMVRSAADLTPEQIKALPAQVLAKGDPARGERIYRRQELACQTCHAIGGAGGMLGPDMTSIGASAPVDYLIESLIDPNAKVKEGYHSVVIETKDDEEYSGIVRRENDNEVVLLNAGNQEVSIAKNNIRNRQNGKSLMPTGLIDMLEDQQRLDLFRFLSELGKSGPYDASQSKVARVFQVYALHSTNQQSGEETAKTGMDYSDRGWQKINTTVVGGLLKEDLEEVAKKWEWRGVIALYAAARFEVSKAGKVNLEIEGPKGASVWIDGKPAGKGSSISRELSAGTHSIVVELDHRTLPEQLRVKSQDVSFLVD